MNSWSWNKETRTKKEVRKEEESSLGRLLSKHERRYLARKDRKESKRILRTAKYAGDVDFYTR